MFSNLNERFVQPRSSNSESYFTQLELPGPRESSSKAVYLGNAASQAEALALAGAAAGALRFKGLLWVRPEYCTAAWQGAVYGLLLDPACLVGSTLGVDTARQCWLVDGVHVDAAPQSEAVIVLTVHIDTTDTRVQVRLTNIGGEELSAFDMEFGSKLPNLMDKVVRNHSQAYELLLPKAVDLPSHLKATCSLKLLAKLLAGETVVRRVGTRVQIIPGSRYAERTDTCAMLVEDVWVGAGYQSVTFEDGYRGEFEFEDLEECPQVHNETTHQAGIDSMVNVSDEMRCQHGRLPKKRRECGGASHNHQALEQLPKEESSPKRLKE